MPFQRAVPTDTPRLLLLLDNVRDWEMLVDRFDATYDVTVSTPGDDWAAFDCCLVDERTLPRVADELAALKSAAEPVFLPVLLLARSERSAAALLSRSGPDIADETVTVPTPPDLLATRLRSLLRTRTLSLRLDDEREQYQALIESATDAIVVFDDARVIQYANPAAESMFGYPAAALIGRSVETVLPDACVDDVAAASSDTPGATPLQGRHADGHEFPVEATVAVVEHDDDLQYTATIRDVTHRKEREQALERSRDLLEKTQQLAGVGGWEIDPSTGAVTGSDETYRIHGIPAGTDLTFEDVMAVYHPEDVPLAREAFEQVVTEGTPFDVTLRLQPDDGDRWVRVKGEAVHEDGTRVIRGAVQDITDRVERERELREHRERLELALDASDAGVWEMDVETDEIVWHETCERLFGLEPGEFDGTVEMSDSFVHPDDLPTLYEQMEAAIDRLGQFSLEFRIERADGEQRWLASSGRVIADDQCRPVQLIGVNVDITDRIEHKLDLEASERRFRAVFEEANAAMVIANDDGEYVEVNSAATELFGLPEDELVGRTIAEFAPPGYDFGEEWSRFRQGESVTGEFPLVRPDGTQLSTRFSATPNILPGRHLSVLRDVTELKAREEVLERHQAIVQAAPDPIYALDADGTFIMANSALAAATGRAVDDLVGTNVEDLFGPDQFAASQTHVEALAAGADPGPLLVTLDTPDGTRHYEVNVVLYGDHGTDHPGSVGVARDVTDLHQREQRLSVLDRVLRHNIRNKLNVVVGRAENLGRDDSATANAIIDAAEALLEMSETARHFESTMRPDTTWTETTLATHLPRIVEEATVTYPEATVNLAFEPGDDPWCVKTHETLDLALEEVLDNAIVHCDRAPEVRVTVASAPEGPVELRIADNGPGLDPVERDALDHGLETPLEHMSGLGLWFVRWAVEASGGTFAIETNEPRGTVVVLRLPRTAA
ncbi:PAS domain S-box protein [Halorarius litoreus]|uniref:PAS domain S-box protein n=1 Tax=Halorarius litoreus TaxID=2962676 RepID=UPI0020CC500B|nr:PAS domain S-box protein [Halorarius litoreus]